MGETCWSWCCDRGYQGIDTFNNEDHGKVEGGSGGGGSAGGGHRQPTSVGSSMGR